MTDLPVACTLTADALACGAAELLPGLAAEARTVSVVLNGARLEFAGERGTVARLAAVIERERECCQFLRFHLEVSPGLGAIVLTVDGPPGTGSFLAGLHPAFASAAG